MPITRRNTDILPASAKGKSLQAIEVYRDEEFLNLDLAFEDGLALELSFGVAYRQQVRLVQWENGNSRVLDRREVATVSE